MNCRGCGVELDPSEEQVNSAVDQILETSLKHAEKTGGVYEYQGTFMTNVSDEKGHNLVHNWYDRGYLKGQEFGQGTVYSYSYDWSSTAYYPTKVRVTLPDFTVKELSVADSVPEYVKNFHR